MTYEFAMSDEQNEEDTPPDDGGVTTVVEKTTKTEDEPKTKRPRMWKVIFLNDDFTPMDFVVAVLCRFFFKSIEEANGIMMEVHNKGKSIAGTYTYEVAETKIYNTSEAAKQNGFPLRLVMEPVEEDA